MLRWLGAILLLPCFPQVLFSEPIDDAAIRELVTEALKQWQVPGTAVVVVREDKVIYLQGHGIRQVGRDDKVTVETIFPLASCSKAFTSLLMGILVDEGTLSWDDPVRKHLPDFELSDPSASKLVTLRDLLSHRTGVGSHDLLWYRSPWSHDEIIRQLGKLPLDRPFRTGLIYQSGMVLAAGEAMAKRTNKPWHELIQEKILQPLEMKSTTLDTVSSKDRTNLADGHRRAEDGKIISMPQYEILQPNASGSVNSNAHDLAAWLRLQLNGGEYEGKRIVSEKNLRVTHAPTTVIEMTEDARKLSPETSLMSYGLGWVIQDHRGEKLVSHTGLIDGFRAHITLVPKQRIGIAILSNLHGTRMNLALSHSILDHLMQWEKRDWHQHYLAYVEGQEFAERAARRRFERARKVGTKPTLSLSDYTGTYEHPAYGRLKLSLKDERLVVEWSRLKSPLLHWHDDLFRLEEDFLAGRLLEIIPPRESEAISVRFLDQHFVRKDPSGK